MPVLAMPIAVPIYLLCEIHVTPAIDVRLPIAVVNGSLIGEVLADRSMRSRRQTACFGRAGEPGRPHRVDEWT